MGECIAMIKEKKRHYSISSKAITFSLESEERKRVYKYLLSIFPAWASIGQIAVDIGSDYRNVKGALIGDGERYSKRYALKKVGLVESKKKIAGRIMVTIYRAKSEEPGK
jgi:predicted transcriptional regulator with HTH domain